MNDGRGGLRRVRRVLVQTLKGFYADRGDDLAASLTFSTLVMAVPLVATLAMLLATFFRQNDRAILDAINFALPYQSARITANLREFIDSAKAVSGIGLIALLATSLRLIFIIENTVNHVWGAPKRKRLLARVATYTMGLFIGALLIGELLTGLAELRKRLAFESLFTSAVVDRFFATLVVAAALTLLYKFIPNAPVSWPSAAFAAGIVALLLRVIKVGFALYFRLFPTINIIYGSLSLVLLLLIALFLFWELVLAGVELTFVLDAGRIATLSREGEGRAELAVRLLLRAAKSPARLEDLQRDLGRPSGEIDPLAAQLREDGLLDGAREEAFHVALPLGEIPLSRVVTAVSPDLLCVGPEGADRVARILRRSFRKLTAERDFVLNVTLGDIAGRR
ncbi:MAG TPA: YihY family inner membrane protein [Thermoanaerobaculia bacterium]|nr:YihY family inner membrane protein [Thermoanaerobaculia bacterium]